MQTPIRTAILGLLLVFAGPLNFVAASDPPIVKPGDSVVDGTFLVPYHNAWRYSQMTSSGQTELLGRWTDEMLVETINGEQQILRKQTFPTPDGKRTLVNRARRSDLAPRSWVFFAAAMNPTTFPRSLILKINALLCGFPASRLCQPSKLLRALRQSTQPQSRRSY